jgi:acetoin utilization deacetylase AcuC-like enzyme
MQHTGEDCLLLASSLARKEQQERRKGEASKKQHRDRASHCSLWLTGSFGWSSGSHSSAFVAFIRMSRFRVFYHNACVLHSISGHPERPDRVTKILAALRKEFSSDDSVFVEAPLCSDEHILMYHTNELLEYLREKCDQAEKSNSYQRIDGDTTIMKYSREAIYRAAGSIVAAVDGVLAGNFKSAFCCVRPPGHHAERHRSMGFCFVNNAAIGAKYAQQKYGITKVAVLV